MVSMVGLLVDNLTTDQAIPTIDLLLHMKLFEEWKFDARAEFNDSKVFEYLVHIMKENQDDVDILAKCTALITNFTFKSVKNIKSFHWVDAAPVIVQSMNKYSERMKMQQWGTAALLNLSLLPSHQQKVVSAGGIEVIVNAMDKFSEDLKIQANGCNCLGALAKHSDSNKKAIIDEGGLTSINLAHENNFDTGNDVEEAANKAMNILFDKDAEQDE